VLVPLVTLIAANYKEGFQLEYVLLSKLQPTRELQIG
jgi:hypothetical protein